MARSALHLALPRHKHARSDATEHATSSPRACHVPDKPASTSEARCGICYAGNARAPNGGFYIPAASLYSARLRQPSLPANTRGSICTVSVVKLSIRAASTERSGVQAYNGSVPRYKIRRLDARETPLHIASGRWFKKRRTSPERSGR